MHLTWENEAHLEVKESGNQLEVIYPTRSIRAEPFVAVVDANVERRGTRAAAEAYLRFLYTDEAQEIIADHYYRPIKAEILRKHTATLRYIRLFDITQVAKDWDDCAVEVFRRRRNLRSDLYSPRWELTQT